MAQEVEIGNNGEGKIRSFWVGFGLSAITSTASAGTTSSTTR